MSTESTRSVVVCMGHKLVRSVVEDVEAGLDRSPSMHTASGAAAAFGKSVGSIYDFFSKKLSMKRSTRPIRIMSKRLTLDLTTINDLT